MADEPLVVERAERRHARLRVALTGVSDGGKTAGSLLLARGIVEEALALGIITGGLEGKIGLVDTERKSASLFSHLVPFDVVNLSPPYSVERYGQAMTALERAGVFVIILDSISHAWAAGGGVLELLNSIEDYKRFSAFGTVINPKQDEFVDRMLRSPCHLIVTMRQKTSWVIEQVEKKGRLVHAPRRVGMKPIQREGIEYEFTTMLGLESGTHEATVLKNRCSVFDNWKPRKLTVEDGRALARWMQEGAPSTDPVATGTPLERAQAVRDAGARACDRAENVPDLARVYQQARKDLFAFNGAVAEDDLRPMFAALKGAMQARQAALGAARTTESLPTLGPDLALVLERFLHDCRVQTGPEFAQEYLGVPRLAQLTIARLQVAVDAGFDQLIEDGRSGSVPLPPELIAAGAKVRRGRLLDDLKDDLPWVDEPAQAGGGRG